jgi:hypothetical protein
VFLLQKRKGYAEKYVKKVNYFPNYSIKKYSNFQFILCSVENEAGVAEASVEDPGDTKFNSDRCKVLIESFIGSF